MRRIPLTQNKYAIVDNEDYDLINQYKWHYNSQGYAYRYAGGGRKRTKRQSMHELVFGKKVVLIDHRDGNGLNNCRSNLRLANKSLNAANSKVRSDNKSGYRCVYKNSKGTYYAQITVMGKTINIGTFSTKELAAKAYNKMALRYFGEFARLNNV